MEEKGQMRENQLNTFIPTKSSLCPACSPGDLMSAMFPGIINLWLDGSHRSVALTNDILLPQRSKGPRFPQKEGTFYHRAESSIFMGLSILATVEFPELSLMVISPDSTPTLYLLVFSQLCQSIAKHHRCRFKILVAQR